jgi:hypothetical protein
VRRAAWIAIVAVAALLLAAVAALAVAGSGPGPTERFTSCLERHGAKPGSGPPAGAKVTFEATLADDGPRVALLDLGSDRRPVAIGDGERTFDWRAGYDRARRAFWACVALVHPRPLP